MASPSSQDSHLHQQYNANQYYHEDKNQQKRKAREEESDWLELGLGFSTNTCRQEEEEEMGSAKVVAVSATTLGSPYLLESYNELQVGLDLRLETGAASATMGMATHQCYWEEGNHHLHQSQPFHMNSITSLDHVSQEMPLPNHQSHYLRKPNSGLWFALRSLANRKEGATLPQIPKAYIRVKDENVTVFTVKKYLVTKLGLSNEAEIEITCMGQKLLQTQTLKQVRDGVWLPRLVELVNSNITSFHYSPQTPSATYLMSLHYGRPSLLSL